MTKNKKTLIRIIVATVLLIVTRLVFKSFNTDLWEKLSCAVIYVIVGYDVLWRAIKNIFHGQLFDENFLMALASLCAFTPIVNEYYDAVAVMLLYQTGELFQRYAVGKSRKSISSLVELRPDTATVVRNGVETELDPSEIAIGETLMVRAGERIALDGIVAKGESALNTSAVTGESMPTYVNVGDKVLSGSINLSGVLYVTTTSDYDNSTVGKILDLVENATSNKAPTENFITKFARYYTPVVVVLALVIGIVPPLFSGEWAIWIKRAMMFLFVSCPCALVISVPLSFFGGIAASSKNGILIKGSNYVELLAKTDIFACDKTGTLTEGKFSIVNVQPEDKRDEILQTAAIAEQFSNHPIALSIREEVTPLRNDYTATEILGKGIKAVSKNDVILCGNDELMKEYGISTHCDGETLVHVARNGKYLGTIFFADKLKSDSKSAIKQLKSTGATVVMLTGDNEKTAQSTAEQTEIDTYYSSLLPQDKVDIVAKLKQNGLTAFVGDGINDAPVLATADVGIAMGNLGSDSAIEASDVVLMYDNLSSLPVAQRIAKKTLRIVKENIVLALSVKFAVLILSALGITDSLILAILADVGVSFVAILNAMRCLKTKK